MPEIFRLEKTKKTTAYYIWGGLLSAGGCVTLLINVALFIIRLIGMFFVSAVFSASFLSFSIGMLAGTALIVLGAYFLRFNSRYKKIFKEVKNSARVSIDALAILLKKDLKTLSRELFLMIDKDYFGNAVIDAERKELVLDSRSSPTPQSEYEKKTVYQIRTERRTAPVYAFAAAWMIYIQVLPLYRWFDFLIAFVFAVISAYTASAVFPKVRYAEIIPRPVPVTPKVNTGNQELDELLETAGKYSEELVRLGTSITNEMIKSAIRDMVRIMGEIFGYVRLHPDKIRQIRQFVGYYIPTTIKLLNNYEEFERQRDKGENIKTSMKKIEEIIGSVKGAFEKELDDLFGDRALDISSEIAVMQKIIEEEGLSDNDPFKL